MRGSEGKRRQSGTEQARGARGGAPRHEPTTIPWHRIERVRTPARTGSGLLFLGILAFLITGALAWWLLPGEEPTTGGSALVLNGDFEKWFRQKPLHWVTEHANIFPVMAGAYAGRYSVGIYNPDSAGRGIAQKIFSLEPGKYYTLSFWYRIDGALNQCTCSGYFIEYDTDHVESSPEVAPGFHTLKPTQQKDSGRTWRFTAGWFRGAQSVLIRFVACQGCLLLVDNVKLVPGKQRKGLIVMPNP